MKRKAAYKPSSRKRLARSKYGRGKKIKYRVQDRTSGVAPVKIKNSKAVKTKVVRKVKVSTELRAKIKKVISDKQFANGSYTDHYLGGGFMMKDRQQTVFGAPNATTCKTAWHFTTPMFMDALAQLFNGKTPVNNGATRWASGSANQLDFKNLTFDVKNSYSTYTIKNGSQHAAHITMCICVPKRKGSCFEWDAFAKYAQGADGVDAVCEDAVLDPSVAWLNSMERDRINGMVLPSYQPDKTSITGTGSVQNPSQTDLFRMPTSSRTFNNFFKVEFVKFFLQPGQVVQHYIQGPKGIEVDMAKTYVNTALQNVQKYSRAVMFIGYNSPNSMASYNATTNNLLNAVPGRWADQIDNKDSGFPIYVERSDHYSFSIPDQIGFKTPATFTGNAYQTLNQRISRSINNVWDVPAVALGAGEVKTVVDLSVMNPQQPVNDGNSDQS